jgi:hypothetical protein
MSDFKFHECIDKKIVYDPDNGLVTRVSSSSSIDDNWRPTSLTINTTSPNVSSFDEIEAGPLAPRNKDRVNHINRKRQREIEETNIIKNLQDRVVTQMLATSSYALNTYFYASTVDTNISMASLPMMHRGALITTQCSVGYQNIG